MLARSRFARSWNPHDALDDAEDPAGPAAIVRPSGLTSSDIHEAFVVVKLTCRPTVSGRSGFLLFEASGCCCADAVTAMPANRKAAPVAKDRDMNRMRVDRLRDRWGGAVRRELRPPICPSRTSRRQPGPRSSLRPNKVGPCRPGTVVLYVSQGAASNRIEIANPEERKRRRDERSALPFRSSPELHHAH